jgi:hypothetical protein
MEAMLRSAGLRIDAHPAREVYYCSPAGPERGVLPPAP